MDAAIAAISAVMRLMVDDPSSLTIEAVRRDGQLTIKVSSKDIRQLIGRQGRNALSLRTLLNAMVSRSGERVVLDLIDVSPPRETPL